MESEKTNQLSIPTLGSHSSFSWKLCERKSSEPVIPVIASRHFATLNDVEKVKSEFLRFSQPNLKKEVVLKLPLFHMGMSKEECGKYNKNFDSYKKEISTLIEKHSNMWILYNEDDGVVETHSYLLDGWLKIIMNHPDDISSILTIPGRREHLHPTFNQQPQFNGGILLLDKAIVKLNFVDGKLIYEENEDLRIVYDTGSSHCVVHRKNLRSGRIPVIHVSINDIQHFTATKEGLDVKVDNYYGEGKISLKVDGEFETLRHTNGMDEFFFLINCKRNDIFNYVLLGHEGFIDRTTSVIVGSQFESVRSKQTQLFVFRNNILPLSNDQMNICDFSVEYQKYNAFVTTLRYNYPDSTSKTLHNIGPFLFDTGSDYCSLPGQHLNFNVLKKDESSGYYKIQEEASGRFYF